MMKSGSDAKNPCRYNRKRAEFCQNVDTISLNFAKSSCREGEDADGGSDRKSTLCYPQSTSAPPFSHQWDRHFLFCVVEGLRGRFLLLRECANEERPLERPLERPCNARSADHPARKHRRVYQHREPKHVFVAVFENQEEEENTREYQQSTRNRCDKANMAIRRGYRIQERERLSLTYSIPTSRYARLCCGFMLSSHRKNSTDRQKQMKIQILRVTVLVHQMLQHLSKHPKKQMKI